MNSLKLSTNQGNAVIKWKDNGLGEIDADAIKAFSWGYCHSFAYEMNEKTGWPIIGIGGSDVIAPNMPGHFVVYDPRIDDFVDIQGAGAFNRYDYLVRDHVKRYAPNEYPVNYRPMNKKMAEPFVTTVLEKIKKIPTRRFKMNPDKYPELKLEVLDALRTL